MSSSRRWSLRALGAAVIALMAPGMDPGPADAQYFGRNQVQYRSYDFRVLQTPHFDIYYYPEEEEGVRDAALMAERWYTRLSRILDHEFTERQPIVLYGSHPAFQQSTVVPGVGEGTGGVTESAQQRIAMPLTGSYQETDHVLGHELVHAFQYDISGLGRNRGTATPGAQALVSAPLWFIEGMAEYLSEGPVDAHTAMIIREAALTGDVPDIDRMTRDPRIFPYTWGQAFWAYVGGRWGDAVVGQILRQVGQGVPYEEAFERILNASLEDIGEDWNSAIRRTYLPLLTERTEAREAARPLITQRGEGGRYNVGPSVSPDGRYVAFLSELGLFDAELYLADAETGEVIRRLQRGTALDPHFQSLRFLNSAGTWSPDSRRFAFGALRAGRDRLVILDVDRARRLEEITIPGVSEITTPTWSPDGRTIVFSGISGGLSDLYAHDLESGETRRLTQDRWANLHPSYSPDGTRIAFVTDQGGGASLETLQYGGYQIAVLDLASGEARILPRMDGGNNINPAWTPDGTGIYFISDRGGAPNLYRMVVGTAELFQLTRLYSGVAGITDVSPALSAAREGDRVVFTVYERNSYNLYSLTTPEELTGVAVADTAPEGIPMAAMLPPIPRPQETAFNRVAAAVADPLTGLPPRTALEEWPVVPYRPRLTLDYLGQPQVGVSTGSAFSRGGLYGGVAGVFSDVLGYHTLYGAIQAQGQLDEIGLAGMYIYRKHRWNFGASVQRVPYIMVGRNLGFDADSGLVRDQLIRLRYFDSSLRGLAQYPFSQVQRMEFSAGARRISRDAQVQQITGTPITSGGQIIDYQPIRYDEFEDERYDASYNLLEGSAALVYDNSLFGYTSPFAGQRYRFEVTPTFGTMQFVQALADYRRYFFLRPFTLAVRGLHFGRYGDETAQDQSGDPFFQQAIYLGQPSLIRGYYDVYSRCRSSRNASDPRNHSSDCAVIDQLFGSRIGVANAEIRFPLIQQIVLGAGFPLPPIEGFAFADAGVAWDSRTQPVFSRGIQMNEVGLLTGDRGFLTSAGVGARINLLGYFILEVDYVNAFERDRGWHWQFALQPGF